MKRVAVAALLLLPLAGVAAAEPYPAPDGYVVDTADALPPAVEARLERELADYDRRTTNQVAVAVVRSLDGSDPADYGLGLFNEWGVGTADRDNGVLLLVAVDDRTTRIQTGLGVEELITDAEAQALLDDVFAPPARAGNLPTAVIRTVAGIRREVGERRASSPATERPAEAPFGGGEAEPLFPDDQVLGPGAGGPVDVGAPVTTTYPDAGFPDDGFPGFFGVAALAVLGVVVSGVVSAARGGTGRATGGGVYFGSTLLDQQRRSSSWSSSFRSSSSSSSSSHSSSSSFGGGSCGGGGASGGW